MGGENGENLQPDYLDSTPEEIESVSIDQIYRVERILTWLDHAWARLGLDLLGFLDEIFENANAARGLFGKMLDTSIRSNIQVANRGARKLHKAFEVAYNEMERIQGTEIKYAEYNEVEQQDLPEAEVEQPVLANNPGEGVNPQDEPLPPPDEDQECINNCLAQGYTYEQCLDHCKLGLPLPPPPGGGLPPPPPPPAPPPAPPPTGEPPPAQANCYFISPCQDQFGDLSDGWKQWLNFYWGDVKTHYAGISIRNNPLAGGLNYDEYAPAAGPEIILTSEIPFNRYINSRETPWSNEFKVRFGNTIESPADWSNVMMSTYPWNQLLDNIYTPLSYGEMDDVTISDMPKNL